MAAKLMAWRPEPQKRLTVVPVTSWGQPAASTALRELLAPCPPAWGTQAAVASSTSAGFTPARSTSRLSVWASSSWGWTLERTPLPPLPGPRGGRTAWRMWASVMTDLLDDDERSFDSKRQKFIG